MKTLAKLGAGITALALVGGFGATQFATAAPEFANTATVNLAVEAEGDVTQGQILTLKGNYALPGENGTPAGFSVEVPDPFALATQPFDLIGRGGATAGRCEAEGPKLVCALDDQYVKENPRNITGEFEMQIQVFAEGSESKTPVELNINGEVKQVGEISVPPKDNPGQPGPEPEGPFPGDQNAVKKLGGPNGAGYDARTGYIEWIVDPPMPGDGYKTGDVITVTELPDNQHDIVRIAGLVATKKQPSNWPDWTTLTTDLVEEPKEVFELSTNDAGEQVITIRVDESVGSWYALRVYTKPKEGVSGTISNQVRIQVNGEEVQTKEASIEFKGGRGTVLGENVGAFVITKEITGGAAADVPEGMTFDVTYKVTKADADGNLTGEVVEETVQVTAGKEWESPEFPRDSKVELTEIQPADTDTLQWGAPQFSQSEFTLPGGDFVEVTLTNTVEAPPLKTGEIWVKKMVTGDAEEMVPEDTIFLFEWSYPAGDGYEAASGEFGLTDDWEHILADLPWGAEVTIREVDPLQVEGTKLETFDGEVTVTVGANDELVQYVIVENEYTKDDTPPTTDEPTPTPPATDEPTPSTTPSDEPTPTPPASDKPTPTAPAPTPTKESTKPTGSEPMVPLAGGLALIALLAGAVLVGRKGRQEA